MKKTLVLFVVLFGIISCTNEKKADVQNISQEEFVKLNSEEIQLLDVRTPNETAKGIIKGATIVNFYDDDFTRKVISKFDKEKPLYIYCAAGGRSNKASSQLILKGFNKVYNLEGGYNEWIRKENK